MKTFLRLFAVLMSSMIVFGCASTGSMFSGSSDFQMRRYREQKLSNGLTILFIEDKSLPKITLSLVVKTGVLQEGAKESGLNTITAEMLSRGTEGRSSKQIADDFGALGSELNVNALQDYVEISATALNTSSVELLNSFADVILRPAFAEGELQKVKSDLAGNLQRMADQPQAVVSQSFTRQIYGAHPYATPYGTLASIKNIRRSNVIRHYSRYYRPNNAYLAVVGNFGPEFVTQVSAAFASWESRNIDKTTLPVLAEKKFEKVHLVSKVGVQQVQIRMGHLGIKRENKDFLTLRAASVILGGAFASRLNQRIRDDLGLTYTINSSFDAALDPGLMQISTFTRHEKATETIVESRKVIEDFVKNGITETELESAKALLVGQFPMSVETPEMLAGRLMSLRVYGVSDDYLRSFLKNVRRLSVSDINEVVRKYLHPENMQIVVYANQQMLPKDFKTNFQIEKISYAP